MPAGGEAGDMRNNASLLTNRTLHIISSPIYAASGAHCMTNRPTMAQPSSFPIQIEQKESETDSRAVGWDRAADLGRKVERRADGRLLLLLLLLLLLFRRSRKNSKGF